jgi:hypothetical protein
VGDNSMPTYFTLLPWDKIEIVQQVPEDYFDKVEEE